MRIIAGKYKNRKIFTPEGETTRPLLARVRKSVLDILHPHFEGVRFLDMYCGTGIMSLEALSRGASFVMGIDQNEEALRVAQRNFEKICPEDNYRLVRGDVLLMLPKLAMHKNEFQIIGITPPFGKDLANLTLEKLIECPNLFGENTVVFAQHEDSEAIQLKWPHLEHIRTKNYGRNVFEFFLPWEEKKITSYPTS